MKLSTPVAIIVAGVIIAGAILLVQTGKVGNNNSGQNGVAVQDHNENIAPVTADEHIQGDIHAPIVMVEYSDLECPFCKIFHETMEGIWSAYHDDGRIAWVYRHFPLDRHPKAPAEAQASECAAELGGNIGFWHFITQLFAVTPSNNGMDIGVYNTPKPAPTDENGKPYYKEAKPTSAKDAGMLSKIAVQIGLEKAKFEDCLASGKYKQKVADQLADGVQAGGNGTPYTIMVLKNKIPDAAKKYITDTNTGFLKQINSPGTPDLLFVTNDGMRIGVSGAQDPAVMKKIVDLVLAGK
ncbi:MAG: thioredoxin domain-containing protein [Candidatus Pacebacteria bacterium]|nr:thioredoxin domain-containing protein [Candidatus Paceibacterota bacterium]MDD5356679.1 thioredoxin domain-containing protein [Candidatus Paceibacterota bacterium]